MPRLPFVLVEEILCRLPVKSLKRFRCVEKSWCSLIDGDTFIKLHLKRSLETNSHRHLIVGAEKVFNVDLDEDPIKASVTKVPFAQGISISNSCNGLFLVYANPLVIWNPFTKEHKVLPTIPHLYPPPMGCYVRTAYGFAYDSRNDDYKIVKVMEHRDFLFFTWMSSRAHIYSLKSNSWRQIDSFPYPAPYLIREYWHTDVNGALHTLIEYTPPLDPGPHKIMAFSVESERHYEVKLPPGIATRKDMRLSLNKIGGCLSVTCATASGIVIWVMKDYGVCKSWTKMFSIDIPLNMDDPKDWGSMKPLVYSKDSQKVLLYLGYDTIFWHDKRNTTVEIVVPLKGLPFKMDYIVPCVESLVSVQSKQVLDHAKKEDKKIRKKSDDFLSKGFKLVL